MSRIYPQRESETEPLIWLAFRYISGEMNDCEQADFETRLDAESSAFDVAACEAVARAVRLRDVIRDDVFREAEREAAAVGSVKADQTLSDSCDRLARGREVLARRICLLTSAVVVAAMGWLASVSGPGRVDDIADHRNPTGQLPFDEAAELVHFWTDTKTELKSSSDDTQPLPSLDVPDLLSADVPDWLLAAVQSREESSVLMPSGLPEPEVLEN